VLLEVASSVASTGVMIWFVRRRWPAWRQWQLDYYDRLFLVALAMIGANAAISYPYLKEVTMSTGGVYYVLALVCALRSLLDAWTGRTLSIQRASLLCGLIFLLSVSWTLRGIGFFVDLTRYSAGVQREWRDTPMASSAGRADSGMVARLRERMIVIRVPSMEAAPQWLDREH
jgi:hypothetical protein